MPPTVLHQLAALLLLDHPTGPALAVRLLSGDRDALAVPAVRAAVRLTHMADEATRLGLFGGPFAAALRAELDTRLARACAHADHHKEVSGE